MTARGRRLIFAQAADAATFALFYVLASQSVHAERNPLVLAIMALGGVQLVVLVKIGLAWRIAAKQGQSYRPSRFRLVRVTYPVLSVFLISLATAAGVVGAVHEHGCIGEHAMGCRMIDGVDVSHWQGGPGEARPAIQWSKVAAAGKQFAYIKATQDTNFLDSQYATNRDQAQANGLLTGPYHFAKPGGASAVAQADYFVDHIQPIAGQLPAALDLEDAGGLGKTALRAWTKDFLARLIERTGSAVFYISPYFYTTKLGNNWTWPADNGVILWIAHWTTAAAPTVPANNWQGNGWTFWQTTSDGSVPGISGRVDLDRFNGTMAQLNALAGGEPMNLNIEEEYVPLHDITGAKGATVYDLVGNATNTTLAEAEDRACQYLVQVPGDTTHHYYAARWPGGGPGPDLMLLRKADVTDHGATGTDCSAQEAQIATLTEQLTTCQTSLQTAQKAQKAAEAQVVALTPDANLGKAYRATVKAAQS